MKARFESNFEYGRKIAKYLLVAAIALMAVGLFVTPAESTAQAVVMFAIIGLIVATIVVVYRFCRCPYCGKHIFFGILKVKVCPACKRNLASGKKTKKYER